jgi:hypothetical protein
MDDVPLELLLLGGLALAIALIAWIGDRRRMRRSEPDAVGFMPWTSVFFWAVLAALVLLALAGKALMIG